MRDKMAFGKIGKSDLREYATNFTAFLYNKKIQSLGDLNVLIKKGKRSFYLFDGDDGRHFIEMDKRPSEMNTKAVTASYVAPCGIPLEFKINEALKYSLIIAKSVDAIAGYDPFGKNIHDIYGNVPQSKRLDSVSMSDVFSELESLKKLSDS